MGEHKCLKINTWDFLLRGNVNKFCVHCQETANIILTTRRFRNKGCLKRINVNNIKWQSGMRIEKKAIKFVFPIYKSDMHIEKDI